ncbi:MAG: ABC transporter permease, partial [Planctomycetaceae bacterium]|nr:ABC transporter permease [Planctomycetaceae bacterium]
MIRPYLAILKDSFREATASRTLLVAMGLVILTLLVIAPLGITYSYPEQISGSEVWNIRSLAKSIYDDSETPDTLGAHLWQLMDDEQQLQIRLAAGVKTPEEGGLRVDTTVMASLLTDLTTRPDLYQPDAWRSVELADKLKQEAEDIAADDPVELKRINRKLLAAAFPTSVSIEERVTIEVWYAVFNIIGRTELPLQILELTVERYTDTTVYFLFGIGGMIVSLLFTSNIIPRSVEAGEISLLLSKPVSRSALFVTKYLGGCFFTALLLVTLVTGVWFLMGVRLGIWNARLLWAIPVYLFAFMIYFSMSATTGLIYRNAIIAFASTVLLWGFTLALYVLDGSLKNSVVIPETGGDLVSVNDQLYLMNRGRDILKRQEGGWKPYTFESEGNNQPPEFLQRIQQFAIGDLLAGRYSSQFAVGGDGSVHAIRVLVEQNRRPELWLFGTTDAGTTDLSRLSALPDGTNGLVKSDDGRVLVFGTSGIQEYAVADGDKTGDQSPTAAGEYFNKVLGGMFSTSSAQKAVIPRTSGDLGMLSPQCVFSYRTKDDHFFVLDRQRLLQLQRDESASYRVVNEGDADVRGNALLTNCDGYVVTVDAEGQVLFFNDQTLEK